MDSLSFLGPLLGFAGLAVVVLAVVAIVQDIRQERKYGYRQAFYTIVTLVMLVLAVGSIESLMVVGLKEAMPGAKQYSQRYNQPPSLYISGLPASEVKSVTGVSTAYTCEKDCQFTADDKLMMKDWKAGYLNWRDTASLSLQTRRNISGGLSLLIISLPLLWFFMRWMNRGAKEEYDIQHKPSPLRSIYFYGVSFAGLVTAVIAGAILLNTAIGSILKTNGTSVTKTVPMTDFSIETAAVTSIINCGYRCAFSQEDIQLAKDWQLDWQKHRDLQNANTGSVQNDLANTIPLILVGLPLFWYHFTRIRREGHEADSTSSKKTS